MPFTKEELAQAEKLLARMEKDARSWAWARWLLIANGVVFLGASAWFNSTIEQINTAQFENLSRLAATTRPGFTVLPIDLMQVQTVSVMYTMLLILTLLASASIVAGVIGWRKGRRDLLWVKIARSYLQQSQAENPHPQ
jgi:hypothetical protein